jgi:hypothetical protein
LIGTGRHSANRIRNRQVIGSSPIVGSILQRLTMNFKSIGAHLGPNRDGFPSVLKANCSRVQSFHRYSKVTTAVLFNALVTNTTSWGPFPTSRPDSLDRFFQSHFQRPTLNITTRENKDLHWHFRPLAFGHAPLHFIYFSRVVCVITGARNCCQS